MLLLLLMAMAIGTTILPPLYAFLAPLHRCRKYGEVNARKCYGIL